MIGARAAQGFGAAVLSPAALSILMVTFDGRERQQALGVWAALAGLGGTLGAVLGGALVDGPGWRWVYMVNVPIAAALLLVVPLVVRESRVAASEQRSFDFAGAITGTAGVLGLIYGVIRAEPLGWGSVEVIASLSVGLAMFVGFYVVEKRAEDPLVPMSLFRSPSLSMGSGSLALNGAAFLGMFFLTAIFLQQVRGESALGAGIQLLPMGVAAAIGAGLATDLVARVGTRPVRVGGASLSLVGLLLLSHAGAASSYAGSLLPGLLILGAGLTTVGVPSQISATADVKEHQAGAASGLTQSGYQVGGALGIAIITTLATSRATEALAAHMSQPAALVQGFHRGLLVAAALAAVNVVLSLLAPNLEPTAGEMSAALAVA
jgi:MFS family permease